MSQNQEILKHLKEGKTITTLDALREFGCFRLAARIKDLRDSGHMILTLDKTIGSKHVAEYIMAEGYDKKYSEEIKRGQ